MISVLKISSYFACYDSYRCTVKVSISESQNQCIWKPISRTEPANEDGEAEAPADQQGQPLNQQEEAERPPAQHGPALQTDDGEFKFALYQYKFTLQAQDGQHGGDKEEK